MAFTYVKDRFVPEAEAVVSVEERGFRFGDGIFETIVVHRGVPYQWELHMQRLETGLSALLLGFDISMLRPVCLELLDRNQVTEGFLRISINRGIGSQGYLPTRLAQVQPTLVIEAKPRGPLSTEPVCLWLSQFRKIPHECLPSHVKHAQGLNATLARLEAKEHGCFEALQLNIHQQVAEGSSSSIFWLRDGTLHTPSLQSGILNGTTRLALLRLSPFPVAERVYALDALRLAEQVVVANTGWGVRAVESLEPLGWQWQSEDLAEVLQAWLVSDMEDYAERR